jgi:hypothetical protein
MKLFFALIAASALICGFVGGLIFGQVFSVLSAVIGAVGLATVVLGLGAILTGREDRNAKGKVPPDIRAVFDRMSGGYGAVSGIKSGWKPRPFHENKSKSDFFEWFANVAPWNEVDAAVVTVLIERLDGNPLFEVFVHAARETSLIRKFAQLNQLARTESGRHAVAPRVAVMLSGAAEDSRELIAKALSRKSTSDLQTHYSRAVDSLEAAIAIEPNIALLYLQMATLKAMVGRNAEAASFCEAGLEKVAALKAMSFDRSTLSSIRDANADLVRVESHLKSVLDRVST